jgi:hypothetical protein
MGAWYFLDLTAPHNILPELRYLFARKRQRVSSPSKTQEEDNEVQPGPSGTTELDTDTFDNNDEFVVSILYCFFVINKNILFNLFLLNMIAPRNNRNPNFS